MNRILPASGIERVHVGDWGCSGVDTDAWRAKNRVPLFPGRMQRWVLVRTLRDNPSEADITMTLRAVFAKWFEGDPLDPALSEGGGRVGTVVDNLVLVKASPSPISLDNVVRRKEDLPMLPPPTVASGKIIYLEVTFAYRGTRQDIPWPTRKAPGLTGVQLASAAQCPIAADWILDMAAKPKLENPPDRTGTEVIAQALGDAVVKVTAPITQPLTFPLTILGLVSVAYIVSKLKK